MTEPRTVEVYEITAEITYAIEDEFKTEQVRGTYAISEKGNFWEIEHTLKGEYEIDPDKEEKVVLVSMNHKLTAKRGGYL